jgi:intron-binding protein aquarius
MRIDPIDFATRKKWENFDQNSNTVRYAPRQVEAIFSAYNYGLSIIKGGPGTGKKSIASQIISNLFQMFPEKKILLVTRTQDTLDSIFVKLKSLKIDPLYLLKMGDGIDQVDFQSDLEFSKADRIERFLNLRVETLKKVANLAAALNLPDTHGDNCSNALYFFNHYVKSKWDLYKHLLLTTDMDSIVSKFPFSRYFGNSLLKNKSLEEIIEAINESYRSICHTFELIQNVKAFELLRSNKDRANFYLVKEAKVVGMTTSYAPTKRTELVRLGFKYDTVVILEAGQLLEVETFIPMLLQTHDADLQRNRLERVILLGDHNHSPDVQNPFLLDKNFDQSLLERMIRLGNRAIDLDLQGGHRSSICDLYRWKYQVNDLVSVQQDIFTHANPGFKYDCQFVNVDDFNGHGEVSPRSEFFQNLGEAEYVVAVYQFMRNIGYLFLI